MSDYEPSGEAISFHSLSHLVVTIHAYWSQRWGGERAGICFRGAGNSKYDLNPSLLREPYPIDKKKLAVVENNLWVDFRLRSKPLLGYPVRNAWEALIIMQQHGFPTRLLDWTRALAVALHFAVRDEKYDAHDGAVWVMATRHLMQKRGVEGAVHTAIGDPALEPMGLRTSANADDEFDEIVPAPLRPDLISPRMISQHCIYTLHTFRRDALTQLAIQDAEQNKIAKFLHKVIIPCKAKPSIRAALPLLTGVTEETMFPDLDGFARDFVREARTIRALEVAKLARQNDNPGK